ncbi:MAG: hypothetical protein Q8L41_00170 [Anaerolineales bacterium]|nr:hypothetical protein [Anaerolineales bacterium]
MNRNDVQQLQSLSDPLSLSILLPTNRSHPENQQDTIRLKNLVSEATDRLVTQYGKREVEPLLTRLEALTAQVDFRNTLDGLALYVSPNFSRQYVLPFLLKERVILDQTFATRDLVFALHRSPRYWTLVLSEKPTRLFEGLRDTLIEIREGEFPMMHLGPGGAESLPGGFGIKRSGIRDEYDRQFFRHVDEAFEHFQSADPLPLTVVGVQRNLAFFEEVSKHNNSTLCTLEGSHDKTSPHELGELVWPLVQEGLASQRKEVFNELGKAIGARQFASGIQSVWQAAQEGRGAILLVEQGFHTSARLDSTGINLIPADNLAEAGILDDAVDELIETVLSKGGQVVFTEDGTLELHQRIVLILRY